MTWLNKAEIRYMLPHNVERLLDWHVVSTVGRSERHCQSRRVERPVGCVTASRASSIMKRATSRTQDIDHYVGTRIRERRIMLGLTQQQLADLIGVTYQQAHKY